MQYFCMAGLKPVISFMSPRYSHDVMGIPPELWGWVRKASGTFDHMRMWSTMACALLVLPALERFV